MISNVTAPSEKSINASVNGVVWSVPRAQILARDGDIPRRIADWLDAGNVLPEYVPPAVCVADIKAEARRRILDRYPTWRQLNIIRDGGSDLDVMSAYIDAVRNASNALEASLPSDYTADSRWPA